jgi:hypothetical protein
MSALDALIFSVHRKDTRREAYAPQERAAANFILARGSAVGETGAANFIT